MMTNSRSSFRPPYAHFAMIYLDRDGKLKVDESSSIQEQNSTVFTPEVRQNFLEILGERIGYHAPARRMLSWPSGQSLYTNANIQRQWIHLLVG